MKLENEVCSLQLAQRLNELGVKQESYFRWRSDGAEVIPTHELREDYQAEFPSAFTVADLGEMLPWLLPSSDDGPYYLTTTKNRDGGWWCSFEDHHAVAHMASEQYADTEADARAKMLVYLLENNLITV